MATAAAVNNLGSYAHNPRGNLWFNDESTFGRKLLLKMGWNEGKGLGKNEDGIKENLKVKFKSTNSGLGYKDDSYANVMKTEYESILKNVRAENSQEKTVNDSNEVNEQDKKALKQKSRVVKNRIRYPKLFYGKDVSKYSEEDMKSIFICSLTTEDNEEKHEDSETFIKESEDQLPKITETYNSGLSVLDYFNMKMNGKKNNEQNKICCNNLRQQKAVTDFESTETENFNSLSSKKISKKKKKNSEIDITGVEEDCKIVASNKKRKKSSEDSVSDRDFSNEKIMEMLDTAYNQSCPPSKKRKKSQKVENQWNSIDTDRISSCEMDCSTSSIPNKKSKKSHKYENGCKSKNVVELLSVNSVSQKDEKLSNNSEVVNDHPSSWFVEDKNLLNNAVHCAKKKKLKCKIKSLKKLKSCLKISGNKYTLKNVSFNENVSYRIIDSAYESTESLSDEQSTIQNDISDGTSEHKKESDNNVPTIEDNSLNEQSGNNGGCTEAIDATSKEESEECCSLSSLPSSKSSYYNFWVESQKQAFKMKIYKNILKNIRKHDVLKTTNLLSLKGYGNWGFK